MTKKFHTKSDITKEICDNNFKRLRQRHRGISPADGTSRRADHLAVTHTFAHSLLSRIFPSKAMEVAGLYGRRWLKPVKAEFEGQGAAHQVGLYEYVFAFHGIHDTHFARDHDLNDAPFPVGVFVSRQFERAQSDSVDLVNATYRDLAVASVIQPPYSNWFLCSEDARALVAVETTVNHEGDFWRYWGNPDAAEFNYNDHWKQLFEFHFYRYVPADALTAIIWPQKRILGLESSRSMFKPVCPRILKNIRECLPEVLIYFYREPPADGKSPMKKAFAKASLQLAHNIVASANIST